MMDDDGGMMMDDDGGMMDDDGGIDGFPVNEVNINQVMTSVCFCEDLPEPERSELHQTRSRWW